VRLGETLLDFNVTYWGIGDQFLVETDAGIKSACGAILAGRAAVDMTAAQRAQLTQALRAQFNVANPKLLPLPLKDVTVQPVFAAKTLGIDGSADNIFPSEIALGNAFDFTVGTGQPKNTLFAAVVARQAAGNAPMTKPVFAINAIGKAEFVGDPWTAEIQVDLSQVWSKVRQRYSASVNIGWFSVGKAEYQSIVADLTRNNVIQTHFSEGSLDNEKYGRQVFEMVKDVLETVNSKITSGEGMFKFEPNPEPADLGGGGGGSFWPWSLSVNASYSSAHFRQSIQYANKVTYSGRFYRNVPVAMALEVSCADATKPYFTDLSNAAEPCITDEKLKTYNARLKKELDAKNKRIAQLVAKLEAHQVDQTTFERELALINTMTFTE
jgi:hypothetical protein